MTGPSTASRDDTNYRSFMRFDDARDIDGWVETVQSQLLHWLDDKGWHVDLSSDADFSRPDGKVRIRHLTNDQGWSLRLDLEESGTHGISRTQVLAHDHRGPGDWLLIEATNSGGHFVEVPTVARSIIDKFELIDSTVRFGATPTVLGDAGADFDELLQVLRDPRRHSLVAVAGTGIRPGFSLHAFRAKVEKWTEQLHGLAEVVILPPAVTSRFAVDFPRLAPEHDSLRFYAPGVDFESDDQRLHKQVKRIHLESREPAVIAQLLGRFARGYLHNRPVPNAVFDLKREFNRFEVARLTGPASSDIGKGLNTLVNEQIEALQQKNDELEDQLRQYRILLDDSEEQENLLLDQLDSAQARIEWYEHFYASGRGAGSASATAAASPSAPDSFVDLIVRLREGELPGLYFTGDEKTTFALNSHDTLGNAVRVCWQVCVALADYVAARTSGQFDGGIESYLQKPPKGRHSVPLKRHGATETSATMQRYGADRIYPVPTEVKPSGLIEMASHFKLARIGRVSPRLHYFDAVAQHGAVFIGYIGPHLPTASGH